MNTQNKLSISMAIFFIFVISFFGYIIMQEKGNPLVQVKLEKKLDNYINSHYQDIIDDIEIGKIHYDHKYYVNVYNKNNHNLFFKVIYNNKKITSTYKKDYVLGQSLINKYEKDIKEIIKCKKYSNIKVKFIENLTELNESTKKKLLTNDNVRSLPIYKLTLTKSIKTTNADSIKKLINNFYNYCNNKNIKPKYYSFIINEDIILTNITEEEILYRLDDIIGDKMILRKGEF